MRFAFRPETGLLTDMTMESSECQDVWSFFAKAIASYEHPHSHRGVNLNDPAEAIEIVLVAIIFYALDAQVRSRVRTATRTTL